MLCYDYENDKGEFKSFKDGNLNEFHEIFQG
jgi:hypothetical protein